MALRVWLPLNGNLNNQGLNRYTYAFNGTYTIEAGKIGQCYKHLNASITNLNGLKDAPMTICFWAKTSDTSSSWQKIIMFDNENASQTHGIYVADSTRIKYEYNPSLNIAATPTEWHHYAFVINDKSSQAYYDGVLVTTSSEAVSIATLGRIRIAEGAGIYLNDVRIYDECLSQKQIKEISKGLVCHYKLDNPYIEDTTNLLPGVFDDYSVTYNPTWDTSLNGSVIYIPKGWGSGYNTGVTASTTGYHARWDFDEKNKLIMVFPNLNSVINQKGRWLGISAWGIPTTDILAGEKYTISWWQKTDNLNLAAWGGIYYKKTSDGTNNFWDGCPTFGYNTKLNTWEYMSHTFTRVNDYIENTQSQSIYVYGYNGTHEGTVCIKDIQLQKGDHSTPYTVGTRLGQTLIKDVSGNGYNGIKSGTLTFDVNSPRYSGSTYFNGSSTLIHPNGLNSSEQEWTCMAWIKLSANAANCQLNNMNIGNRIQHNSGGNALLYLNSGTNDYYNYSSQTIPLNTWTHIAFVFKNSDLLKKIYINGIDRTNTAGPNSGVPLGIQNNIVIGTNFNGYMSDYREYATALSADEILTMYENSGIIDKRNNVYAYEFKEE